MATERVFVFGVDLDGVCADYYGGLRPIAAEWLGKRPEDLPERVSWGLPEWGIDQAPGEYEALHRFAVTQRDLFKTLKPIAGAPQALRVLDAEKVRIRIITHRFYISFFHQVAAKQTIEWLDFHGIPYWDLCFMKEKTAVGADLYVEDSPTNIAELRDHGQDVITFTNSTNEKLEGKRANNWTEVIEHVRSARRAAGF